MSGKRISLKLYDDFKCMGGSCPTNCCIGWNGIIWKQEEIDKLLSSNCSERLLQLVKSSFVEKNGKIIIKDENGRCPFLNEDNMCSIQLELGHDYLSHTCRRFPRKATANRNIVICAMGGSCYEVLTQLCNSADSAKLVYNTIPASKKETVTFLEDVKTFFSHPELKYRNMIFELLYDVLADESYSVETGIVLGALAMQKISQFAEKGEADRIPEVIKAITPQLKQKAQIEKLEAIKPNYALKFSLTEKIMASYIRLSIMHDENGEPSVELYHEGEKRFAEAFKDKPFAMRNILINALLDTRMPCYSKKYSLYDNYCYYAFFATVIKYFSVIAGFDTQCETKFKKIVSQISRKYCHTEKYIDTVLADMKKFGCTSPAYLASLIK